jgi:hypothetical protein
MDTLVTRVVVTPRERFGHALDELHCVLLRRERLDRLGPSAQGFNRRQRRLPLRLLKRRLVRLVGRRLVDA